MKSTPVSSRAVALLCAAQFVVVLDATIVAVALPAIGRDLGFSATSLPWVVSAYGLVFGGFLMLLGRAADLVGRRRLLVAGFALFGAASLACGLAQAPWQLLAARAAQGLGAAAVSPAALALLTAGIPDGPRRTRALGAWTAAAAGGGALGWVAGGAIADGPGWPWVFLVNVAPCAAAIALALRLLPADRGMHGGRRLDVAGAVAATAGLGLLVLGFTRAEQAGPGHVTAWGSLAAAAALLGAFARIERRAADPLLPPGTLGHPRLAAALVASLAVTTASTGPLFLCVLYLQDTLGRPAAETGLLFAPFNLAVIAGSAVGARLLGARGARVAAGAGLLALGAGAAALLGLPGSAIALALPAFALLGLGVGCAAVASTAAGTESVEPDRQGLVSGLLNTAAQLGNALGLSAFVLLAAAVPGAPATGFRVACATAALTAAAGALAFGALHRRGRGSTVRAMDAIPVSGVSELVLEVVDLEAAERFYAGVLGFPVVDRWPDRGAVWVMAGDRTRIGLWRPQIGLHGGRGGLHVHFAMKIAEEDFDATVALLESRGQQVKTAVFGTTHGRAAYVDDPDGNVVEFWTWDVAEHLR